MKRLLLSLTLALFAFSGSVNAQETRFNEEALMKKLTKLEADSKDAKKGAKAATWLELGKVYENAATGLTNGLYVGLDSMTTELVFPKPERGVETINGVTYSKWSYPDFDVYLENGVVSFWSVKKVVVEDALAKAAAAYNKAYELDNSTAEKVAEGLGKVVDGYKQDASNFFELRQFIPTAEAFAAAFDLQRHPTLNRMDTASCYYAGYIYTLGKKFDLGEKYLKEAIDNGYESEGDAYYYLFHSYYGQKKMDEAKQILLAGDDQISQELADTRNADQPVRGNGRGSSRYHSLRAEGYRERSEQSGAVVRPWVACTTSWAITRKRWRLSARR